MQEKIGQVSVSKLFEWVTHELGLLLLGSSCCQSSSCVEFEVDDVAIFHHIIATFLLVLSSSLNAIKRRSAIEKL